MLTYLFFHIRYSLGDIYIYIYIYVICICLSIYICISISLSIDLSAFQHKDTWKEIIFRVKLGMVA